MTNNFEQQYLETLLELRGQSMGTQTRQDRTKVGTVSMFHKTISFDFSEGWPLMTHRKIAVKTTLAECLWILNGCTNVNELTRESTKKWWAPFAKKDGSLGPIYGYQLRYWQKPNGEVVDQLQNVIDSIKSDPAGRRHVISLWNPGELDQMALPPCHSLLIQFYVNERHNSLSMSTYQRSADWLLGIPANLVFDRFLLETVCELTGYVPGKIHHTVGDAHLYLNHMERADAILARWPEEQGFAFVMPQKPLTSLEDLRIMTPEDYSIVNYKPNEDPLPKAPMAVGPGFDDE